MKVRRLRRVISGLLIVWLGLLQFPLPFAVRAGSTSGGKDLSVPFPCMNRPCGCRSAEECWTGCCCTTKAERIAFVLEHGLQMPAALEQADDESAPKKSCCVTGCVPECSASGKSCGHCSRSEPVPKKKLVSWSTALKCKGQSSQLLQFGGAVLRIAPVAPMGLPSITSDVAIVDDLAAGVSLAPPSPPPRIPG
jgi:hypothetical protein